MKDKKIWTTKTGEKILISEMDDKHLLNAYKMLWRNGFIDKETLEFYLFAPQPNGDGAQMAFEQEQDEIFSRIPHSSMGELKKELEKRKIEY